MIKWRNRALCVLAVATLLVASLSATAFAEEVVYTAEAFETETVTLDAGDDSDELIAGYIEQCLNAALPQQNTGVMLRGRPTNNLSGNELVYYDFLKPLIVRVAAGELSSTVFEISVADICGKTSWTASELGVSAIMGDNGITQEAKDALYSYIRFELRPVLNALLADCPYELYWFDKTQGMDVRYPGCSTSFAAGEYSLGFATDAVVTLSMSVSADYSTSGETGTNEVDTETGTRVRNAVAKAEGIVSDGLAYSGYERLMHFKNEICELTDYNYDAVSGETTTPYGDPWQLIYVFDGDASTKVVCEGYSKAFQYLCDLANTPGITCYTVTGSMDGGTGAGGHMWNLVKMDNGKVYLVDVTNCDQGFDLFVVPYDSIDNNGAYVFEQKNTVITYAYDERTTATYATADLSVASKPYSPPVSIESSVVFSDIGDQTFTGEAIEPEFTVTYVDGTMLEEGVDYTVEYDSNTDVGEATVTITGMGDYYGTSGTTFNIVAADISQAIIDDIADQSFTGSEIEPPVTVIFNGMTLVEGKDYTVAYSDNSGVGIATVTITGMDGGNFTGTTEATFEIVKADISDVAISAIPNQTYTGSPITPSLTVTFNGMTLEEGTDYELSYSDNTEVGTATVTITATEKSNFTGTKNATFIIVGDLSKATIATIANQIYTGSQITPAVTVSFTGKSLAAGTDYAVTYGTNVNAGTGTVTINGKGNYTGTKTVNFTISPANLSAATVSSVSNQPYTGNARTPGVTLSFNGTTLTKNTDYTVSYADNTNAGKATVTITGKGNFTGTRTVKFSILPVSIAGGTISAIPNQTYTGSPITPKVTFTFNGKTLKSGTDYTVSYSSNTNVGTATVTVTAKGNYTGAKSATFRIVAAHAAGWFKEGGYWYYYNTNGLKRTNDWVYYGGWYYLGSNGRVVTNGLGFYNNRYYYIGSNGRVISNAGWRQVGGTWHYFGYSGAYANQWLYYKGAYYFFNADSSLLLNGWVTYNGNNYYMGSNGKCCVSTWVVIDGKYCYFNTKGLKVTNNWVYYNRKYYFMDGNGNPVVNGWVNYNGMFYHFNSLGVCDKSQKTL